MSLLSVKPGRQTWQEERRGASHVSGALCRDISHVGLEDIREIIKWTRQRMLHSWPLFLAVRRRQDQGILCWGIRQSNVAWQSKLKVASMVVLDHSNSQPGHFFFHLLMSLRHLQMHMRTSRYSISYPSRMNFPPDRQTASILASMKSLRCWRSSSR